jgi:hypothetical protein
VPAALPRNTDPLTPANPAQPAAAEPAAAQPLSPAHPAVGMDRGIESLDAGPPAPPAR